MKFLLYLNEYDFSKIYEIRLRKGFCVKVKVDDEIYVLGNGQVICEENDIDDILKNVTERSLYAFNESLKKGFLTTKMGVRIGLAGECVYDNGNIVTIKSITSLNIRVPHLIEGSAKEIYDYVLSNHINSTLIISPPFFGKTTMLKDLVNKINSQKKYNVLVVDERNEFCFLEGECLDIVKYSSKDFAFSYGIRSMSPDVIITDELMGKEDWKSVERAIYSGVKVIASCHGNSLRQIIEKDCFISGLFDIYVVLDSESGRAGVVKNIYNGVFKNI